MRDHTKTLAVSMALVVVAGTAGCASTGDRAGGTRPITPLVLKVFNTRSSNELQSFIDQVKTLSGGKITLDITHKWHAADDDAEPAAIKAVQAGQAAIGFVPTRAFHDLGITSFDALGAPLTIDSLALEQRVLASDIPTTMLKSLGTLRLHGLGVLPGPMRKPVGLTRKLITPSDYRGARIAISASPVSARALATLGATTVASRFEGSSMAPFDGLEQQVESVEGNQYDAPGSSITANVNLWARPLALFANAKAFDALPAGTRALLQKAATSALPAATKVQATAAADSLGNLCRRGTAQFVNATPAQLARLRTAFGPAYAWLRRDSETATAIDRINAMRSGLETAVATETPSCPNSGGGSGGSTGQANAATALDGVFESTVTAEEVLSHGGGPVVAENIGHFFWVFDRGRIVQVQESKDACTWGYGTFAVTGDRLTNDMIKGGGIAPNNATAKPGEHGVMAWSIYHDVLTLTPTEPERYWIKPMRRVHVTPSSALFSRRCPPPASALPARTALDGTWRTTFSKAELSTSPLLMDPEENNDDNWGTLTMTFANGQINGTMTNTVRSGSSAGTYAVQGDTVFLYNDRGEIFTMRWSIYKDTLTLRRDKTLGVGPTPMVLKPWTRVAPGG